MLAVSFGRALPLADAVRPHECSILLERISIELSPLEQNVCVIQMCVVVVVVKRSFSDADKTVDRRTPPMSDETWGKRFVCIVKRNRRPEYVDLYPVLGQSNKR